MKKAILATVFGLTLLGSGAALADETQGMQPTPAVAVANDSQVICRSMSHNGDIIKKQTCMTISQWKLMKTQNQQYLRDIQMRGDLEIAR